MNWWGETDDALANMTIGCSLNDLAINDLDLNRDKTKEGWFWRPKNLGPNSENKIWGLTNELTQGEVGSPKVIGPTDTLRCSSFLNGAEPSHLQTKEGAVIR